MHDVRKLQILRTHYNHQFGMDMRRHGETALWPLHLIYTYSGLPCTKGRWDRISKKHQLRWHRCIKIFDSPFKSLSNQLDLNYTVIFFDTPPLLPLLFHRHTYTHIYTHHAIQVLLVEDRGGTVVVLRTIPGNEQFHPGTSISQHLSRRA